MRIYKKYMAAFILATFTSLTITAAANYILDPFQIYHDSYTNPDRYLADQERYQNLGLIRKLWREENCCETIMLGTSMSQNFENVKTGEKLKTQPILNLSMAGASPAQEYAILEKVALIRAPKTVLWELHTSFYKEKEPENVAGAGSAKFLPEYLYDNTYLNDLPYLLSISNVKYALKQAASTYSLYEHKEWFTEHKNSFGKAPDVYKTSLPLWKKTYAPVSDNGHHFYAIEKYLIPALQKYTNTTFIFYFPPYSLHSFASVDQPAFDRIASFRQELIRRLEKYPNASLHMFDDLIKETENLALYKDPSHYNPDIGYKAMELIASGRAKLTQENIQPRLQSLTDRANAYCQTHTDDCRDN